MQTIDLKKILKDYYDAKPAPKFIAIPKMQFIMIDGQGNPNTSPDYADVIQTLYSVAYTLKFKTKKELLVDYPVMALEGLWWTPDMQLFSPEKKDDWFWTMMISIPDFINSEQLEDAIHVGKQKKDLPAISRLRFEQLEEGLSAQLMHIGPYSAEAENIQLLHKFIHDAGHSFDGITQKHHEIYLSDPRKTAAEKLKTIIRQPIK